MPAVVISARLNVLGPNAVVVDTLDLHDVPNNIFVPDSQGGGYLGVPTPAQRLVQGGSRHRDGEELALQGYDHRTITIPFMRKYTSTDDDSYFAIRVRRWLREALLYHQRRWGPRLQFQFQPSDASIPVTASVLNGTLERNDLNSSGGDSPYRLGWSRYTLTMTCDAAMEGPLITLPAQTIANKPQGIQYRYLFDSPTLASVNLAGRVDGPLWVNAAAGNPQVTTSQITPASGDYVALGDPDGTFSRLSGGVAVPLAYTVSPAWGLHYSTGASTWNDLLTTTTVTLFNDANPSGVTLTNIAQQLFTQVGEFELRFTPPSDWVASTANGLPSAHYLRIYQDTALGTYSQLPSLQWGPFRTGRGLVNIPAAAIPGDLPARAAFTITPNATTRRLRASIIPNLTKDHGIPTVRLGTEYATVVTSGAFDGAAPAGFRGQGAYKIGTSTTDWAIAFDGAANGYLDFGTTNNTQLGTSPLPFTLDFWCRPRVDSVTGDVDPRPQALAGSWNSAGGQRKLVVLLLNGKITLLLSRDNTTVISQDQAWKKNKRGNIIVNPQARLLQNSHELQPNRWQFVRIVRRNARIGIFVDGVGAWVDTVAIDGKLDTLGASPLAVGAAAFRLGWQVSLVAADIPGGPEVIPYFGDIDQFRVLSESANQEGTPELPAVTATTLGLYLFNGASASLANSATTTPMAAATRSPSGTSDVEGKSQVTAAANIHAMLPLSWSVPDTYRGTYKVLATVRTGDLAIDAAAIQANFWLTDDARPLTVVNTWQSLDLGDAVFPYQQVSAGFSTLGSTQDQPERLELLTDAPEIRASSSFWFDEVVLLRLDDGYLAYDTGPNSLRAIPNGGSVVWSSIADPPQVGQLTTTGKLQLNPDRNGLLGDIPMLHPAREHWVAVTLERFANLESNSADTATVVVTIRPRFLSLQAIP